MDPAGAPARVLPTIDLDNSAYWTAGKDGLLVIHRCADCDRFVHPPASFCPFCEGRDVSPVPVSGRGCIETFTVNHKQWLPGLPVPYVLALISIEEAPEVRLVGNITHCDPADVDFGMAVEVWFEPHEELWIPFFRPAAEHI